MLCSLPFDAGPCDAAIPVYTFQGGQCVQSTYGGCEGNDNRFHSLDECLAVCAGAPSAYPCPAGRIERRVCIACGPAGGCAKEMPVCAEECGATSECSAGGFSCYDGVCQAYGCF